MKKKNAVIVFFLFVLGVASFFFYRQDTTDYLMLSKEEQNIKKLQTLCDVLTAENIDGHIYQPIIGRLRSGKTTVGALAQKSTYLTIYLSFIVEPAGDSTVLMGASKSELEAKVSFLSSVVGVQDINLKEDTEKTFGICAAKKRLALSGAIDTFMEIK